MNSVSLMPGTRYTKNGISVDIEFVEDGEVYLRRWPKGVETQSFLANCIRMPVDRFTATVILPGVQMESPKPNE